MKKNKAIQEKTALIITGREPDRIFKAAHICSSRFGLTFGYDTSDKGRDMYLLSPEDALMHKKAPENKGERSITVCIVPSFDEREARSLISKRNAGNNRDLGYELYRKLRSCADYIFAENASDMNTISEAIAFLAKHG